MTSLFSMKKEFKIFMDFDGTMTEDVGESIFLRFGKEDKIKLIIEDLLEDKISSKDFWFFVCDSIPQINKEELDKFIDGFNVDPGFGDFYKFCNENEIKLFILSDGFDYYIERILKKEGLEDIKYYSNKLQIIDNKLIPSFPYLDIDFPSSANCKRNHIINNSGEDEYTVFIGDGNSDKYAVQYCDFIFAKGDLLKFCEKERISYFPFNNFYDVKQIMTKLLSKKRLKKRHQAELRRREAYMQE
jgi:2-hydroxy-3-keto-5-methylthiopentenyl-1-phosphate phosphatase